MEKNPGGQNFGNGGEGRFREILSCPPKMRVAPQMPPPNSETWRRHCLDNIICKIVHQVLFNIFLNEIGLVKLVSWSGVASPTI